MKVTKQIDDLVKSVTVNQFDVSKIYPGHTYRIRWNRQSDVIRHPKEEDVLIYEVSEYYINGIRYDPVTGVQRFQLMPDGIGFVLIPLTPDYEETEIMGDN